MRFRFHWVLQQRRQVISLAKWYRSMPQCQKMQFISPISLIPQRWKQSNEQLRCMMLFLISWVTEYIAQMSRVKLFNLSSIYFNVRMQCCEGSSSRVGQGTGSMTEISLQDAFIEFRNILKMSSWSKCLQFYQMDSRHNVTEDRARCLTFQKARARLIKETFINEGYMDRDEFVAKQVFKYSTLLSQKMLDKIKTEQLQEFERDVQEYCKESEKMEQARRERQEMLKQLNVSQHLSDYKNSTKVRYLQTQKKRTKTCQSYQLVIEPGRMPSPEPPVDSKMEIPLGNKKIKQVLEQYRKKQIPDSRFRVNGKGMNSQIIQMLERLDEIESIQKLRKHRERLNDEEQEYLQGRSDLLKKQKERLSTAVENHERPKFVPMGRIKKHQRNNLDKNQLKIQQLDYLKKLHTRNNKGLLQPLKKSATLVSSNYVGKASIQLEQGLPKSIKDHIPHHKKIKRNNNGSMSISDSDKKEIFRSQNITPSLPRSNNLFITHAFA